MPVTCTPSHTRAPLSAAWRRRISSNSERTWYCVSDRLEMWIQFTYNVPCGFIGIWGYKVRVCERPSSVVRIVIFIVIAHILHVCVGST
jgi:hypothetical protein